MATGIDKGTRRTGDMVALRHILPRRTELTPRRHLADLLAAVLALDLALDNLLLPERLEYYVSWNEGVLMMCYFAWNILKEIAKKKKARGVPRITVKRANATMKKLKAIWMNRPYAMQTAPSSWANDYFLCQRAAYPGEERGGNEREQAITVLDTGRIQTA